MNEATEIMSGQDTSVETKTGPSTQEQTGNVIDTVKPKDHDEPGRAATAEDVKNSVPFAGYKDELKPQDEGDGEPKQKETEPTDKENTEKKNNKDKELAEMSTEKLRDELKKLQEALGLQADGNGVEEPSEPKNDKPKSPEMERDIKAEIKRMLLLLWRAIKKWLFKGLIDEAPEKKMVPDQAGEDQNEEVAGSDYGISDEEIQNATDINEAKRQGLQKQSWSEAVKRFRSKKGTRSEMDAEAEKLADDQLYRIKPPKEGETAGATFARVAKQEEQLKRLGMVSAELAKRALAAQPRK